MAEAVADNNAAAPAAPPPALPIKLLLIIVMAALVAGLGGAFVVVKFMGGHGGSEAAGGAHTEASAKSEGHSGEPASPAIIFDLDPFIVNLADAPDIRYLKLTMKLELENQEVAVSLTNRIPQIRDTILVLLSSKDSLSVRTPQGKFQLRDEILQRVNGLLVKPGVKAVYFVDMVVQ